LRESTIQEVERCHRARAFNGLLRKHSSKEIGSEQDASAKRDEPNRKLFGRSRCQIVQGGSPQMTTLGIREVFFHRSSVDAPLG
jgi:hypothetical protein